jgi:dTDP-4-dehydrorhamnose reductase
MKVFIFGANGMLGRYLVQYLSSDFEVIPITRKEIDLQKNFSLIVEKYNFKSDDVIINAAGIIKQREYSPEELIRVNSLFPHFLSTLSCNVIHITTDCVFSGNDGFYTEDSLHDCLDDYGKSKSLGENPNLTIIRTSIIGEELQNKKSLIEWVKTNHDTTINGYLNHFWNGITCLELSKHIVDIIKNGTYWKGVRHYCSPDTVNKYQLVSYINEIYELNNAVKPVMCDYCDRSLSTNYTSPVSLPIKDQIIELKKFNLTDRKSKMKNFPSINFISIPESEDRRKSLYESAEEYGIQTVRPYIYERYKEGDHKIQFPDPKEFPDYTCTFPEDYMGAFTSHLKMIKEWYETTDEPYALFCEDDISFETVDYWNFTWEEFFNNLPKDWSCIQLSLTRYEPTMFRFFQPEVYLRHRCWCDWSACGYLINRERAKRLLDTYYDGETFIWDYRGSDKQIRIEQSHQEYCPYEPGIETIIYSILDNKPVYTFPLFVENCKFDTTVWNSKVNFYIYSYESIIDWWKTKGKLLTIRDLITLK